MDLGVSLVFFRHDATDKPSTDWTLSLLLTMSLSLCFELQAVAKDRWLCVFQDSTMSSTYKTTWSRNHNMESSYVQHATLNTLLLLDFPIT